MLGGIGWYPYRRDKPHPRLDPEVVKPMPFESPNARSKSITIADGPNTGGGLNVHPSYSHSFTVGLAEDKGSRRTMEDSHSFVVDFDNIRGQGYFGLFDGHAGKHAAEWCGAHFHEHFLENLHKNPEISIPEVLNATFHSVDRQLSQMAQENKTHSGCTAVAAFVRIEDAQGRQSFRSTAAAESPIVSQEHVVEGSPPPLPEQELHHSPKSSVSEKSGTSGRTTPSGSRFRSAVKGLANRLSTSSTPSKSELPKVNGSKVPPFEIPPEQAKGLRKVLYAANAGDARAVLCRNGEALRLTYDHKGNDPQETKRIQQAGGYMMNNRVNGVLAVTRALGDSSMKDYVVGAPYTTQTELCEQDEFLIIACDGLWDVSEDQETVDLVRGMPDAQSMAKKLLDHALAKFSTDNVTVIVVKFKHGNAVVPTNNSTTTGATDDVAHATAHSKDGTTTPTNSRPQSMAA